MKQILIVDDEQDIRELIGDLLKDEDYVPLLAKNSTEAFEILGQNTPDALILDIWLQGSELDGLGILEIIQHKFPDLPVIIISGHGNVETAVTAIRMGAYDYIEKPFKEDRILLLIERAIEAAELKVENAEFRKKDRKDQELLGTSQAIKTLYSLIDRVAPTQSRVMITGPAGVGKEVVARIIHRRSKRVLQPFIILNAANFSPNNVTEELFGGESGDVIAKGPRKVGMFEKAQGGTLFIDEVADIPLEVQGKLLKVLQENSFAMPGSNRVVKCDVRVIAASNRNLEEEIKKGAVREDLFYRLNVVPIAVPSLADRREDIPLLCQAFMEEASERTGLSKRIIADDAMAILQSYDWPGNVRQLHNIIEWLLIMAPGSDALTSNMLPPEMFSSTPVATRPDVNTDIMSKPLREARELFEKQYLSAQLLRFGGNISRTASFIGMERSALHRKLKMLDVTVQELEDA